MSRNNRTYPHNAFYGIGVMHGTNPVNIGTLWRHAYILGASFIYTINTKYKKQSADVIVTPSRIPLYHYSDLQDLTDHLPYSAPLVGVELTDDAVLISDFEHPQRAVYLLGSEANGLSDNVLDACHHVVKLPGHFSMNVSVAGSIIMHDRINKINHVLPKRGSIE